MELQAYITQNINKCNNKGYDLNSKFKYKFFKTRKRN